MCPGHEGLLCDGVAGLVSAGKGRTAGQADPSVGCGLGECGFEKWRGFGRELGVNAGHRI